MIKLLLTLLLVIAQLFSLRACSYINPVIGSLPVYESRAFYTSGGFQDYTDYAKYTFESISAQDFESSEYFRVVNAEDIEEILLHIDNFEGWVETCGGDLQNNYDFDKGVVSEGDFFYIATLYGEPIGNHTYQKFDNYDLYYFDTDTQILYYFHNNI